MNDPPPEFWVFVIGFMLVCVAIGLTVQVLFLLSLSKCLRRCHPDARKMEPGMVWLNLIPCFSLVWMFITVGRVAESLQDEFYDRRLRRDGDFGRSVGTAYAILTICSMIPYLGSLLGIGALVCFILYWVKIAGYSRQLHEDAAEGSDYDDRPRRRADTYDERFDDDEDDDRPRRRRRDEDDDDR